MMAALTADCIVVDTLSLLTTLTVVFTCSTWQFLWLIDDVETLDQRVTNMLTVADVMWCRLTSTKWLMWCGAGWPRRSSWCDVAPVDIDEVADVMWCRLTSTKWLMWCGAGWVADVMWCRLTSTKWLSNSLLLCFVGTLTAAVRMISTKTVPHDPPLTWPWCWLVIKHDSENGVSVW